MKERVLVIIVIILIVTAGAALARPVGPDGQSYPAPTAAAIEPYPVVWPTLTATPAPTMPLPTAKPEKPKPTAAATLSPPDGLPYIP